MSILKNSGYSYKITITAEELSDSPILAGGTKKTIIINPPVLKNDRSPVGSIFINKDSHWSFTKISEPRYDGIAYNTGVPCNNPDMISEHHMIGVLRAVDKLHKPKFEAMIKSKTFSTAVKDGKVEI